jgi:hypothetical protein
MIRQLDFHSLLPWISGASLLRLARRMAGWLAVGKMRPETGAAARRPPQSGSTSSACGPLSRLGDAETHAGAIVEPAPALAQHGTVMDEDLLSRTADDETVALGDVEPLHRAFFRSHRAGRRFHVGAWRPRLACRGLVTALSSRLAALVHRACHRAGGVAAPGVRHREDHPRAARNGCRAGCLASLPGRGPWRKRAYPSRLLRAPATPDGSESRTRPMPVPSAAAGRRRSRTVRDRRRQRPPQVMRAGLSVPCLGST